MAKLCILVAAMLIAAVSASEMKIPSFTYAGERVTMRCNVGIPAAMPSLKSITWLKDGKEFYVFKYNYANPITVTNLDGVTVNLEKSSMYGNAVTIDSVNANSAGLYTCKVVMDHPSFDVAEMSATLKVVAAPQYYGNEGYKY